MSIKTKRIISLACFVISVTGLLLLLSWFYIRGAELHLLKDIPADCEIICTKQTQDPVTKEFETEEFPLSRDQLTDVLSLVRKNAYWRIHSFTITHNEMVDYHIYCKFSRETRQEYLILSFVGDYAVAITSSVEKLNHDGFLRNLNKNFLTELESIITP